MKGHKYERRSHGCYGETMVGCFIILFGEVSIAFLKNMSEMPYVASQNW